MGYCTWWLTIALCFSALAASQGNEILEPQVVPFDDSKTKEPPMITVFDDEEVESDDDEDMTEEDEGEMKLLSRDFMDTNLNEVKGQPVFERDILLMQRQALGFSSTTTTATTTTTTPQTTTTATAAPEPNPKCTLGRYNKVYYWNSPGFGVRNYPNNFACDLMGRSLIGTAMLTIKLQSFELEKGTNGMCSTDKLETALVYNRTITYCGRKSGRTIRSPSFNFFLLFSTNEAITKAGFGMFITATKTPCHQVIKPAAGETNKILPPKDQQYCEYRIVAPTGKQVQIVFVKSRLSRSQGCVKEFILLNGNSEKMYPAASSEIICGKKKVHYPLTSTKGEMYVAYKRGKEEKIGFILKYTIV